MSTESSGVKMGRPLMFPTPEDMQKAVDAYFDSTAQDEWTITGLALALNTSKRLLCDYADREGYKEIVATARLKVEHAYEISLRKTGRAGDIFALKNFGWKDKQEHGFTDKEGKDLPVETPMSAARQMLAAIEKLKHEKESKETET